MLIKVFVIICVLKISFCEDESFAKSVFPHLPVAVLNTDNEICREESDLYIQNLENFTLWAYDSKFLFFWSAIFKKKLFSVGRYG